MKLGNAFDRGLYKVMSEALNEVQTEVYVSSFTTKPDQLSQWRAYCPSTGGYAIGFRRNCLVQSASSDTLQFLARCIYDPSDQEDLINQLVEKVAEFALKGVHDRLLHDRIYRESYKLLGHLIPIVAPALKDPSFEEEAEWRLVSLADFFESKSLSFRDGRSMLVPHYEHSFRGKVNSESIEEIVIGPTPHPLLAIEASEALLASVGLISTKVRSSSIPYRSW